jgi:plastocyanin
MLLRLLTPAIASLALVLTAACGGESLDEVAPVAGVTTIAVEDNRFEPRVIEVDAGTEVTWDWANARAQHNVIGDGYRSEVQRDGTFAHRFEAPGSYDFICTLHGGMTGRVIVTAP